MSSINDIQAEILENFCFFEDWSDRYRYLISLGYDFPDFPKDKMTDENFVRGCQSQVWFYSETKDDGRLRLYGTSDAAIVKGLMGLLLQVFDNQKPEDILSADLAFIKDIGFDQHLSVTRSNVLHQMIKSMKKAAADSLKKVGE